MTQRTLFALAILAGTVVLASGEDPKPVEIKAHTALVHSVAVSPDGKTLATAGFDKVIKLWSLEGGTPREVKTLSGHTEPVYCVVFSPDGKTLASSSLDKTIRTWSIPEGKPGHEMKGHTDIVDTLAFSPDGKFLASGSGMADKSVRL